MVRRLLLAAVAAGILLAPQPASAQSTSGDCQAAQQIVERLTRQLASRGAMVPTGWTLPPYPWIAGAAPYPYPYIPTGWRPLNRSAEIVQSLQQLGAYACAPGADPALAQQYQDVVTLLGYLQGDVADAIEAPAREILSSADSPRVRELAATILAAVATLRRGGGP